MSLGRRRRQLADEDRVLAVLPSEIGLSLFQICRASGLRAWKATAALDRLLFDGLIRAEWDAGEPPRRRYLR